MAWVFGVGSCDIEILELLELCMRSGQSVCPHVEPEAVGKLRRLAPALLRARHRVVLAGDRAGAGIEAEEAVAIVDVALERHGVARDGQGHGWGRLRAVYFRHGVEVVVAARARD